MLDDDEVSDPPPVQGQLDELHETGRELRGRLLDLERRIRDLERPPPVKMPPSFFRIPLGKSIASLDKHLAEGTIDQALYDQARTNLIRADEFWKKHPDGYELVVDLDELAAEVAHREARAHLRPVDGPDDTGGGETGGGAA